ncbi:hypothetical protein B0O80DRAFT_459837 [Mortierella sp. GBAus27b]|nr:hypothetical protein BGX31_002882 [Mortierella sp. GBA43]KAI8349579.1 hypothetical protein B0O80DRAFT_459837 [Mortierella sp. GBAus27b]
MTQAHPPPKILISGAGLGGLFFALLLEKAGISYHIYEKAAVARPLGATVSISAHIQPAIEQLGLMKDLNRIGLPCQVIGIFSHKLSLMGNLDIAAQHIQGYDPKLVHRPDLYNIMLSRIPAGKISLNKGVVDFEQDEHGVTIRTSDGETHRGDILVGADGAYSSVRSRIFEHLEKEGKLPAEDKAGLWAGSVCLAGTTGSLDPEKFPILKDGKCHFMNFIGEKPYSWMVITLTNNKIAYIVNEQLYGDACNDVPGLRKKLLTPEGKERFIKNVSSLPIKCYVNDTDRPERPHTLGDLIQATDPNTSGVVLLEERMFETWYHGRAVLLGDSAHKMHVASGMGCVNAMEDAVVLTNCLYEIADGKEALTTERIIEAFRDYREQRYEHAKYSVKDANLRSKVAGGHRWTEKILRWVIIYLPKWVKDRMALVEAGYRPQASFLPMIAAPPTLAVELQKPSKRFASEQAENKLKAAEE